MVSILANRVAVVTGAAGGIGSGITRHLLAAGAQVLAVDRAEEGLQTLAAQHENERLRTLFVDLTSDNAPGTVMDACREHFGPVEILVNNAGVGFSAPVAELSDADWSRTLDVDLTSSFRLSRESLPELCRSGHGRVINISSVFGLIGFRGSSVYAAAKAGINALTRSMAIDYAKDGVTANSIAPGLILTAMSQHNLDTKPWYHKVMPDATPIRRLGTPDDVAALAVFLASDAASFITGQTIAVDGGWSVARFQAH